MRAHRNMQAVTRTKSKDVRERSEKVRTRAVGVSGVSLSVSRVESPLADQPWTVYPKESGPPQNEEGMRTTGVLERGTESGRSLLRVCES